MSALHSCWKWCAARTYLFTGGGDCCCRLRNGLHLGEALFELAADHFVHAHEEADGLWDEGVFAIHGPGHNGVISTGSKRELSRADTGKWFHEFEVNADEVVRPALGNFHSALTHLAVASPGVNRTLARRRAFVRLLHIWIDFGPRRP